MSAKNKNNSGFMRSRLMTVLLCCAIIWIACVIFNQQSALSNLESEGLSLEQQIKEEQEEKKHIENQMKNQNETQRIEQDAREMGMVKPNDVVFKVSK